MIDSSKLAQLFKDNQRKGQEIFPELIKKLIVASANSGLTSLRFPSGDSIWASSFDGYVTGITNGDSFLPTGNSVWELGTNRDYNTKIKKDYKTRTEEAVFFDKSEYTFILCTPFIFDGNIHSSESNMQNDRIWKNVKIYDAEIISDWLNKHIEVTLWLYKELNNQNSNLRISTAHKYLSSYLNMTNPKFTHDIILCSQNNNEGNQIKEFAENLIAQEHGVFILFSPISIEHGALFSLSVINNDQSLFEKTIVVENIESLSFIESNVSNKIIIINFYWNGIGLRLSKNRYIYIVTDESKNPLQKLNNIRFDDFKNNLEKMGFDAGDSYNITERTNRNISCLKRMYATDPLLKIPTWAQDAQRSIIIPLALVSEIDKRFVGDIETVNQLYNNLDYISALESQKSIEESPVFHFENVYKINYKEEVLFTLNINNEDSYIKKLETIFKDMMSHADPIYSQDLKQWDFRKTNHRYSESLIRGIIETFIILVVKNPSCQVYYDHLVEGILKESLNDFTVLNTVIVYLSLLAELSPNAILKFIDDAIDENNDNFKKSFETEYGMSVIHDKSKFYDYKFAIDKCLYNKDTALDALRLIFRLYNSDYKYPKNFKVKDYVIESFSPLSYFVIPVKPHDKFKFLKSLISDHNKEKSLNIIESFINGKVNHFMIGSPIFKYRENPEKQENEIKEIFELNHEAIIYLLDEINDRLPLYKDLLSKLNFFERRTIEFIFDKIAEDIKNRDEIFKSDINFNLLDRIYDIQRFVDKSQNDSWRYQAQYLDQLIELYNMSISSNPYYKYRYLFVNSSYNVPYLNPISWNSSEQEPDYFNKEREKRTEVYNEAFDELFASKIDNLSILIIEEMKDDFEIGRFLSQKSERKLIDIKKLIASSKLNALSGYLAVLSTEQLKSIFSLLDEQEKNILVKCFDLSETAYSVVRNTDYEDKYWIKFDRFYNQKNHEFEKIVIDKLIKFNPIALVSYYTYDGNVSYEDKILLLESLVGNDKIISNNRHNVYYIEKLVEQLDKQYYNERLVNAELGLLPFLISSNDDYPEGIKRFFLENPLYLYQFLKACSVGNLGDKTIAGKVLADCTISIGGHILVSIELIRKNLEETYNHNVKADIVNQEKSLLEKWFNSMLSELNLETDEKIFYVVESLLILVLSISFSYNVNNQYDHVIAELLEKLGTNKNSEDKRKISGRFYTSKFNNQGVRSVGDGSHEALKADNFLVLSEKYKIKYPIISSALKTLSDSFYSMSDQDKKRKILGGF